MLWFSEKHLTFIFKKNFLFMRTKLLCSKYNLANLITHLEHVEDRRDECLLIQNSVRAFFYTLCTVKIFSLIPIEAKPFGLKTKL